MKHRIYQLVPTLLLVCLSACQNAPQKQAENVTPSATPSVPTQLLAHVEEPSTPATPDSMQLLIPFVPVGYKVLYTLAGNLNRDTYPDRVVVLDTVAVISDSTELEDANQINRMRRPLLLLLGKSAGNSYTLAARNDDVIMCTDCAGAMGGDPFQQIVIKNGYFSVEHYGGSAWRWISIVTFKYVSADHHWYLHREGSSSFHVMAPDTVKTDIRTVRDFGRVRFEEYTEGK